MSESYWGNLIKSIRRLVYWVLPFFLLYLIIVRIDFDKLVVVFLSANLPLILVAIILIVLVVVTGALRWHFLLRRYDCASLSVTRSIAEYWKSLAVGVLMPGSLGSDAYRVMFLGRHKGRYLRSVFVIGIEKLAALFSCAILIISSYALLPLHNLPSMVAKFINALYIIIIVVIVIAISVILIRRHGFIQRVAEIMASRLEAIALRVASLTQTHSVQEDRLPRSGLTLMMSALSPAVAFPTVALSLTIYLVTAIQAQLYFQALGYDLPFAANLFVTPLLFLLFTLPISFGGVGIREGAFIVLYGAFGVPAEIALAVSFCGLLSILLSYGIGSVLFFLNKNQRNYDGI